jgi:hypothetical protein
VCDLLAPWIKPDTVLFATDLSRTDIFADLLERMRAEPQACVAAYNDAVAKAPGAHVRPLATKGDRIELPLWLMPDALGRPRKPAFAADLASVPLSRLAPRALLMTAMLRLSSCDLFIHGTGGGLYDQITELWLARWLPGRTPAPTAVVTATRLLPFEEAPPPTREAITSTVWRAHHALHNPSLLDDAEAQRRKAELLNQLRTARAQGRNPADSFHALHALLSDTRAQHQGKLEQIEAQAARARSETERAKVFYDRTWPFPLYPDSSLAALKGDIDKAFGPAT